jgi:hypothetical protein
MSGSHVHSMAANTLIMDICHCRALGKYMMQHPKAWTLCWHSVDTVMMLCWRSVDAVLTLCWRSFWGVTVSTNTILPIQAANTSIMEKCHSTALQLYKMHHTKSLPLCWRSFSDCVVTLSQFHLRRMAANTLILGLCCSKALGLYMMQHPNPLTLCWHSVDTVLMLCWRSVDKLLTNCWRTVYADFGVQWYGHTWYYLQSLRILRLCIYTVAQPLEYTKCNTPNRWPAVDAHFQGGDVAMSQSLLLRTAASTLIMDICRSRALELYKMQYSQSLTLCWHYVDAVLMLCWRSVDAHVQTGALTMSRSLLLRTDANSFSMRTWHRRAPGFYKIQHPKSLTLCWQSVDAVLIHSWQSVDALMMLNLRCSSINRHNITYKGCQYFDYG